MQHRPDVAFALTRCTDHAQIESAVNIITAAFVDDPAIVYFVGDTTPPGPVRHNIVAAITNAHFRANEPIFLFRKDRQVVGAALIEVRRSAMAEIISVVRTWRLWRRLPKGCIKRMNRYRSLARRGNDRTANYLTMIGILPELQGNGLGKQFIDLLEGEVDSKRGWSLDTENPKNVILYEKLGYDLVAKVDWEDNTIYQMHKAGR
ncbi:MULTISPECIES: GNAT family N-acetyltransferase [unclassified Yoonia]|uniref:GNAT family N-acetyltransferase n=1 Tax=unclassified Yoonia TaxID=2629118 RepID=UPI002AFDCADF|nr:MULTISPECIES: GNAT family N-acetyltransferase [unclassified Yoonia]